jgi:hypothetical protein
VSVAEDELVAIAVVSAASAVAAAVAIDSSSFAVLVGTTTVDAVLRPVLATDAPIAETPVAPAEHAVGAGTEFLPKKTLNPRQFEYSVAQKAWLASGLTRHALYASVQPVAHSSRLCRREKAGPIRTVVVTSKVSFILTPNKVVVSEANVGYEKRSCVARYLSVYCREKNNGDTYILPQKHPVTL